MGKGKKISWSFEKSFRVLRDLSSGGVWDSTGARRTWEVIYRMSSVDPRRFFEEALPYVRSTGFFEEKFPIPMITDPRDYYSGSNIQLCDEKYCFGTEHLRCYVCFGWRVDEELVALLGEPDNWGESTKKAHAYISNTNDEQSVLGVDVKGILGKDQTIAAKTKAAKALLEARFANVLDLIESATEPSFFLFGDGFKIGTTVVLQKRHVGSREDADAIPVLDTFQEHKSYDQDLCYDAPFYSGAIVTQLHGSAGIHELSLDVMAEKRALSKLKKAGVENPSRAYHFVNHM